MGRKKTDLVQLSVRMKESMRIELEAEAEKRDISLNDEVLRRIERGIEGDRIVALVEFMLKFPDKSLDLLLQIRLGGSAQ